MKKIIIKIIEIYQKLTKTNNRVCRFYPTCSDYTKQAVNKYGIFKGLFLGTKRIMKCHPFHKGDYYDPLK